MGYYLINNWMNLYFIKVFNEKKKHTKRVIFTGKKNSIQWGNKYL
jgi:hypothetical protein